MIDTTDLTPTITAKHASELIGCSIATVTLRCKDGEGDWCYKSGGWQIYRERLNDLERDIKGNGVVSVLIEALEKIEKWFGEFPESGSFYDGDKDMPVSYGCAYGSNGERDYMRGVARRALENASK